MAPLPGTTPPRRFVPKLHYELLVCGARGHELIGTDAAEVRPEDAIVVFEDRGQRWHRCLRCDSWLPLDGPQEPSRPFPPERDEIQLPRRGKPLRDRIVLRLIAIDRALHFLVLALLGGAILLFASHRGQLKSTFYRVVDDLQRGVGGGPVQSGRHAGILKEFDRLFALNSGHLKLFGAAALAYALLEGIEAVGLWYEKRWAEYLTLLVTASFLPIEVKEIVTKGTWFKIFAFVLNVAVVIYLLSAKRLFGVKGGHRALEREREKDMGWGALERAAPG